MILLIAVSLSLRAVAGTLIVLVPAHDGLVVAADRRVRIGDRLCDGTVKIVPVAVAPPTAIAVDGVARITATPPGTDPCRLRPGVLTAYDLEQVVKAHLEHHALPAGDHGLTALARTTLDAVRTARPLHPGIPAILKAHAGRRLYQVVIATYNPRTATSRVQDIDVWMNDAGTELVVHETRTLDFPQTHRRVALFFGIADFVNREVRELRPAIIPGFMRFLTGEATIAQTSAREGLAAAVDLIEGAARVARFRSPESSIGGGAHGMVLGRDRAPRALP